MKIDLFGYRLMIERTSTREKEVGNYHEQFEKGLVSKVWAVKYVRSVFFGTSDSRSTLKGAVDFIDRR